MKYFAFVMSFYLLFLSVAPCHCSELVVNPDGKANTEFYFSVDNHQMNADNGFACSSFCYCSHCPNLIIVKSINDNTMVLPFSNILHIYVNSFIPQSFSSIWRPPQLNT